MDSFKTTWAAEDNLSQVEAIEAAQLKERGLRLNQIQKALDDTSGSFIQIQPLPVFTENIERNGNTCITKAASSETSSFGLRQVVGSLARWIADAIERVVGSGSVVAVTAGLRDRFGPLVAISGTLLWVYPEL